MDSTKIKAVNFFTVLTLCLLLLFCILPIHGEGEVYQRVLRLHVIANSDSEVDQSLKLKVRDAVLEYTAPLLVKAESREEAAEVIIEHTEGIEAAAEKVLKSHGCENAVSLEVCAERYPTKDYESFCFPSGKYLSVKVKIGKADGKNWWCVLFPRLCTDVAVTKEEQFIAVGFTPDQYKIITESDTATYKIRFRLLEFFEELGGVEAENVVGAIHESPENCLCLGGRFMNRPYTPQSKTNLSHGISYSSWGISSKSRSL